MAKRKWYKKKTTWGSLASMLGLGLQAIPNPICIITGKVIFAIAAPFSVYSVADRAGKPNEGE